MPASTSWGYSHSLSSDDSSSFFHPASTWSKHLKAINRCSVHVGFAGTIFLVDLFMGCSTGFVAVYNLKRLVVMKPSLIAEFYITHGTFWFDLISALPVIAEVWPLFHSRFHLMHGSSLQQSGLPSVLDRLQTKRYSPLLDKNTCLKRHSVKEQTFCFEVLLEGVQTVQLCISGAFKQPTCALWALCIDSRDTPVGYGVLKASPWDPSSLWSSGSAFKCLIYKGPGKQQITSP